jgi:Cutinase
MARVPPCPATRRPVRRAAVVLLAALLLLAGAADARAAGGQPVEGTWLLEHSSSYVVQVRRFLSRDFAGTTVRLPRGTRCAREFLSRPWTLSGHGSRYTGLVPWVRLSTCRFLGYGRARWTLADGGKRLRICAAPPPSGPAGPGNGDPTKCHTFVRLRLSGSLGAQRVCFRDQVVGVRGSGEALAGPYAMGATVGRAAGALRGALGARGVGMFSLPYRAAPVSDLTRDLGRPYLGSIAQGVAMLGAYLRELGGRCGRTRVALVGYSQGAAVVSEAVRRLAPATRRHVRAVVLVADPYSAGASVYARTPSLFPGGAPRRIGRGSLGARRAALPDRTTDVCFKDDVVCDAPGGVSLALLHRGLSTPVHTLYRSCCQYGRFHVGLLEGLGAEAARRLRR